VRLASRTGETSLRAHTLANVVTTEFSYRATNSPQYEVTAVQVTPSNGPSEWQDSYREMAAKNRRIVAVPAQYTRGNHSASKTFMRPGRRTLWRRVTSDWKGPQLGIAVRALALLPLLLWGCAAPSPADKAAAKRHYLTAKNECVSRYPQSLTAQSDCRSRAADIYIRPVYKYGDLMSRAQEQRHALAVQADRHEITRGQYDRGVAESEAAVAREEDRRNARAARSRDEGPLDPLIESIASLFR
jgi:hypothetical protein